MNPGERLENIAHRLELPLLYAWVAGTLVLQELSHDVELPSVMSAYANLCGDYMWPVLGARIYGVKGMIGGAALMIGIETTPITQHIPLLKHGTPDIWDLPAAGIGALEGFFLDRYRKRHQLGRYAPRQNREKISTTTTPHQLGEQRIEERKG